MESARRTRRLLQRHLARREERSLQTAVAAWRSAVQSRRAFRLHLQEMVDRRGLQLLRGALCGWQEAAEASRVQRVRKALLPSMWRALAKLWECAGLHHVSMVVHSLQNEQDQHHCWGLCRTS